MGYNSMDRYIDVLGGGERGTFGMPQICEGEGMYVEREDLQ